MLKPYYETELGKLYHGDCLEIMPELEPVDLVVTSPPYDNLRDYEGYVFDFEKTATCIYNKTKDGGVVVWVVGDETKNFCESLSSFKQALFFVEVVKFNLLDTMIYHKSNYAPAYPTLRRYASTFEYMFIFCKGKPKTFNPIQKEKIIKNYKGKRCFFRQKDGSQIMKIIDCDRDTKNAENVWTVCPTKSADAENHPAVFPEQLAHDHIISWSNEGDTVADIMVGSGTTLKMAEKLNRRWIGIEISEKYCEIAAKRIEAERKQLKMI